MSRTFVVSDVHGCCEELRALVKLLDPREGDKFVFLGDLVDKGPDSIGVINYVRDLLGRFPGSLSIAGNHEEKAIRLFMKAVDKKDTSVLPADEPWMHEVTAGDIAWLATFPLIHRMPEHNAIAVHGGIYPKFYSDHPEGIGEIPDKWHKGGGKKMDRVRKFLRVRKVDETGGFLSLGDEKPDSRHWSELYDGREGFAFYGHEPFDAVREDRHAMGIDTSCVHGGSLTAAVIVTGPLKAAGVTTTATDIQLVQVPALQKYKDRRTDFGGLRD